MLDVAIIGGGPGGLTAGLYAARGGANALLFESALMGGQILNTELIENYPGFENGIDGYDFTERLRKQASRFGLKYNNDGVIRVEHGEPIRIYTKKASFETKTLIIATGATPKKLDVDGEARLTGRGVSYCAVCDGALFRDKLVAVVGGGDTAITDALYLSRFAKKVYVIHRREGFRATKKLLDDAMNKRNIEFLLNKVTLQIEGEDSVSALRLLDKLTNEELELAVAGVFIAIGTKPSSDLFAGIIDMDEHGYIITDARMRTSLKNVFCAGDVRTTPLKQVLTAAADGAIAATGALELI